MRDLYSQCTCVHMYVHVGHTKECQFEVTLGMSICAHARAGYRMCALHDNVGTAFLGNGGRGGQCGWPFTMYIFAEPSP